MTLKPNMCYKQICPEYKTLTAGVSVLSAAIAAFSMGIALDNSASHSSLIVFAFCVCLLATASSALTICQSKQNSNSTHQ